MYFEKVLFYKYVYRKEKNALSEVSLMQEYLSWGFVVHEKKT